MDIQPPAIKQRRHNWPLESEMRRHGSAFEDNNNRTERTCPFCGLVRVTVHDGNGLSWREWRHKNGKSFTGGATPPCVIP